MTTFVVLSVAAVVALLIAAKISGAARDGSLKRAWGNRDKAWAPLRRWAGTFFYISVGLSNVGGMLNPDDSGRSLPWWLYWIMAPTFLIWGIRRIAEDVVNEARDDALKSLTKRH